MSDDRFKGARAELGKKMTYEAEKLLKAIYSPEEAPQQVYKMIGHFVKTEEVVVRNKDGSSLFYFKYHPCFLSYNAVVIAEKQDLPI